MDNQPNTANASMSDEASGNDSSNANTLRANRNYLARLLDESEVEEDIEQFQPVVGDPVEDNANISDQDHFSDENFFKIKKQKFLQFLFSVIAVNRTVMISALIHLCRLYFVSV
jgi:hypothetical protein